MKERNNKILFYCVIVVAIVSFIILGMVSKKELKDFNENKIINNENIEDSLVEKEEKKINENYILNPNKIIDEFIFLTNTYEEKKDIAIWYSEKDFYEFKVKAPDGNIYDISNKSPSAYNEKTKVVEFHFVDMKPGRWEIAYNEKGLDSDVNNYGFEYLFPKCKGIKEIKDGKLIFNTISEYGTYNFDYKIIATGTNEEDMYFANTLLEGSGKTNKEEVLDISEFLNKYSEEQIIVSVQVNLYNDVVEFFY